ncbi:hypothetical protein EON63_01715 [archaeon]|nr:MAG: hypothetical protein EON63_01715 [archaeon]
MVTSIKKRGFMPTPRPTIASQAIIHARKEQEEKVGLPTLMPYIILLAIVVVPEVAADTPIPAAENVPLLIMLPIILLVIVAFVTSFPELVVAE